METKDTIIECIKIIRSITAHSTVYTTHDKDRADSVKEDVIQALCKHYDINYEMTKR